MVMVLSAVFCYKLLRDNHCINYLQRKVLVLINTSYSRAFDGSNYTARQSIAKLLGTLLAYTQEYDKNSRQI